MITGPFLFPSSLYICLHVREREFLLIFVTFIIVIIAFILITHLIYYPCISTFISLSSSHVLQDVWPIGGVCSARCSAEGIRPERVGCVCVLLPCVSVCECVFLFVVCVCVCVCVCA